MIANGERQSGRLVAAIAILLWPPVVLLASHESYDPVVAGRWSMRLFQVIVVCGAAAFLGSSLAIWLAFTQSGAEQFGRLLQWIRSARFAIVICVGAPIGLLLASVVVALALDPGAALRWKVWLALADFAALALIWSTLLLWTGRSTEERRALSMRLLAVGFGLTAAIVLVEIAGNLLGVERAAATRLSPPNRNVRWTTVEFDTQIVTNGLGLREPRDLPPSHPDTFRFVVVGDSMTFGHGVEYQQTYAHLAQRHLREQLESKAVEFVNVSVQGASPADYLHLMRTCVSKLKPDAVIIAFYTGNDCPIQQPLERRTPRQLESLAKLYLQQRSSSWLERSAVCRIASRRVIAPLAGALQGESNAAPGAVDPLYGSANALGLYIASGDMDQRAKDHFDRLQRGGWIEKALNYKVNPGLIRGVIERPTAIADMMFLRPETQSLMEAEWNLCATVLEELIREARKLSPQVAVLVIPHGYQVDMRCVEQLRALGGELPDDAVGGRELNDRVIDFCRNRDVPFIDPMPELLKQAAMGEAPYFPIDSHLNPEGHATVSESVAAWARGVVSN